MWSIVSVLCVIVAGVLGFLTTVYPWLVLPPHRWWVMGAFIAATVFGALALYGNERQEAKDRELYERLALGRGGFPTVSILGMLPVGAQVKDGRVLAQVRVHNETEIPVLDCRIKLSHYVGAPHGFLGTDNLFYDFSVLSVNPYDMPHALYQGFLLKQDEPNLFSALVFARWARFTQRIVVVWKDGQWQSDTEVTQLADKKQKTEAKVLKEMRVDLRKLLPGATAN